MMYPRGVSEYSLCSVSQEQRELIKKYPITDLIAYTQMLSSNPPRGLLLSLLAH